jgi:hypothetical protein
MGWKVCLIAVAWCAYFRAVPASAGELYVFIAAVSDYESKDFLQLPAQILQAEEFKAAVISSKVPLHRIQFVANLKKDDIKTALTDFAGKLSGEDRLLVLVSGHGIQNADGEPTFCGRDSTKADPDSRLGLKEIRDCVSRKDNVTGVSTVLPDGLLVIMDCCRSNVSDHKGYNPPDDPQVQIDLNKIPFGTIVFCGCRSGGIGLIDRKTHRSYFLDALILGWKGAADRDRDSAIGLAEYFTWVAKETKMKVKLGETATPSDKRDKVIREQIPCFFTYNENGPADVDPEALDLPFLAIAKVTNGVEMYSNSMPLGWKQRGAFKRVIFNDITMSDHTFSATRFRLAHFNRCHFVRCNFIDGVDFADAVFEDCTFEQCDFVGAGALDLAVFRGKCSARNCQWPDEVFNSNPPGVN